MNFYVIFPLLLAQVYSHGYLKEPISRTSLHLRPEFDAPPPYYWDNSAIWCGNVNQDLALSGCGRCGDVLGETHFQQGGEYDKGIIVANYTAGSIIEVTANFQAAHYGSFQVELCPQEEETDFCFQLLNIVDGSEQIRIDNRICVPHDNSQNVDVIAHVLLPAGVRCNRCTLRWTYRTSYPGWEGYDICFNPHPAQVFRNCADIGIY
ncbi:uncharacterized protein LOC110857714 [Folsomia candida]|uniref:Chitin-binding type-4 domain-containing protein n=1 Tax=Folsomia candida TaxID=158441 RepID=A0A226DHM7_FOLCA|nr:uncharacterized protein LOC110857714 [Folsomia candida]OXA44354.1 hypothetical protein Fcan01_20963 [Folsomia candida]